MFLTRSVSHDTMIFHGIQNELVAYKDKVCLVSDKFNLCVLNSAIRALILKIIDINNQNSARELPLPY